jgi:hypothetical protein
MMRFYQQQHAFYCGVDLHARGCIPVSALGFFCYSLANWASEEFFQKEIAMDGQTKALRERWQARMDAAFERMFSGKSQEELVTLTEREDMAVLIGRELSAFLLEEHVARDAAVQPKEAKTACCPKCGRPGVAAAAEKEQLPERKLTTRTGEIRMRRERWKCSQCRIIFFSARRAAESRHRKLQSGRAGESGASGE